MNSKYFFMLFVFLIIVASASDSVLSATLGVNKVEIEFNDVLKAGYAEDTVVISTGSVSDIEVYYEARGDIAEWIRFEPNDQPVVMNQDTPQSIKVIVEPPADARVEDYEGMVILSTGPLGSQSGNMGTNIVVAFEIKIKVKITDTQILRCVAGGFNINDVEIGNPLPLSADVQNTGNVRIKPSFEMIFYDKEQTKQVAFLEYTSSEEIFPTSSDKVFGSVQNELDEGQYWVEISEPVCNTRSLITFSVLEKGGISDLGELVRINNEPWASTSEIVPITVQFRNRGERTVSAQFKGVISKDGKIIEIVNSDIVDVAPDELVPLEVFFTPENAGQYKINGRVYYNNKITYEKGSILNVNPGENYGTGDNTALYIVILVIIIIIIVMLVLIIKKKKRRGRKKIF